MLPILTEFLGITIFSYPLFWGIAWGIGFHKISQLFVDLKISSIVMIVWVMGLFLISFLGAKLLFLITAPKEILEYARDWSFWYGGGLVFYGGFLLGSLYVIATFRYWFHHSLDKVMVLIPTLVISHAVGRLGCFLAGCCFGKSLGVYMFPTQLLEVLFLVGLYLYFKKISKSNRFLYQYLIGYGSFRFLIEFMRDDHIRGYWLFFTPSQWLSLVLILLGIQQLRIVRTKSIK